MNVKATLLKEMKPYYFFELMEMYMCMGSLWSLSALSYSFIRPDMTLPQIKPTRRVHTKFRLENLLNLWRSVGIVWQSAPGWTAASVTLIVLQSLLPLASLYLTKMIVDVVTNGLTSTDQDMVFNRVLILISIAGAVALFSAFCRILTGLVNESQAQAVTDHVQDILHSKSIEVDLEYYENPQFYDTFHRAQQESIYRPVKIVNDLAQFFQNSGTLLAVIGLLASLQWTMALALLAAAIPGVLIRLRYSEKMYQWQCRSTSLERKSWYMHWMLTTDGFAKEVRLFNLGPIFKAQFNDLRRRLRREKLEIEKARSYADLAAQICSVAAVFGSFVFLAHSAIQGIITLGGLVMYFAALQQSQGYFQGALNSLAGLHEDNLFITSLFRFLDMKPKVVEPSEPIPVPRPMRGGISFEHISFRYPGSERPVLEDISLRIMPGETIALVGENGSGKTTLIKLLCRLYDPTAGRITLDGLDLRQFLTEDLHREMGVIFQDYSKYNLTVRENIWFGNVAQPMDQYPISEAARCSGADRVISGLNKGYETILGRWFEDGEELSIGEWQKVALARAFLSDAQIIVMDEPTSALDARSEEEVFKRFEELAEDRTAILISHRLSTVKMADRIYLLKGGRIAESGTHEELMKFGGEYEALFSIQAKHYETTQTATEDHDVNTLLGFKKIVTRA